MSRATKKTPASRVQYAALPYRRKRNSRTEVLLVTSRDTGRWIIPKGWPAKRKSPHKAAAREALEEAGVIGRISRRPLGAFSYKKRLKSGKVVICEVQVFVMKVKRRLPRTKAAKTVGDRVVGNDHPCTAEEVGRRSRG
jgi:8-oxo-dGTP pyrophosphatase MutT (NUDIX family)